MVTLRTYANVFDAGYAHSLLEAAGIQSFLHGEHSYTLEQLPALGGIRLQVAETDLDRARQVIEEGRPLADWGGDNLPDGEDDDGFGVEEETPPRILDPALREGLGRLGAFLKGGLGTALLFLLIVASLNKTQPREDHPELGVYLLIFLAGGVLGIFLRWLKQQSGR